MKLIVAVDEKWGIGRSNRLLFGIPKDMKFFRETTTGHTVVMGRSTLESMPNNKPLPKRRNIVLTRNKSYTCDGAEIAHSTDEAATLAGDGAFVIGGSSIYSQLLPFCDTAYITKVFANGNADCFFPNLDQSDEWEITKQSDIIEDNGLRFVFCTYNRITC